MASWISGFWGMSRPSQGRAAKSIAASPAFWPSFLAQLSNSTLSAAQKLHAPIALEQIEQQPRRFSARAGKAAVALYQ